MTLSPESVSVLLRTGGGSAGQAQRCVDAGGDSGAGAGENRDLASPCTPDEAGISLAVIRHYAGKTPLLGVCLGHQAIARAFGATIVRAAQVMHGKTSLIEHNGEGVFQGLNNPLTVTRYHSLVIDPPTLTSEFNVTARSASGEIMGIRHREWDLEGVQFHPESILSEQGHQLLANFFETVIFSCY